MLVCLPMQPSIASLMFEWYGSMISTLLGQQMYWFSVLTEIHSMWRF